MENIETLVLGKEEVEKLLSMEETVQALENALKKEFQMPPKVYLPLPQHNGDFRAMPAYQEPYASLKWVNVHPNNPQKGLPTVMATILLNRAENAVPLAIMEGTRITAYRTGAMGALASKYLARKNSQVLGLVGSGVQARTQLLAHQVTMPGLTEALIYDRKPEAAEAFIREMQPQVKMKLRPASTVQKAVEGVDILCTVTPSRKYLVERKWVKEGTHINAIGADAAGKQELDPQILKDARLIADDLQQAIHGGEPNVAISQGIISESDIKGTLIEVIRGEKKGRENAKQITVFTSTGLAIQDLATASKVYENAKAKGIGLKVRLV